MDVNEGSQCRHGWHFTSPIPCPNCLKERTGAWRDYGGYGYPYKPDSEYGPDEEKPNPIRCEMCAADIDEAGVRAMEELALTRNKKWVAIMPATPALPGLAGQDPRFDYVHHCTDCWSKCAPCAKYLQPSGP